MSFYTIIVIFKLIFQFTCSYYTYKGNHSGDVASKQLRW